MKYLCIVLVLLSGCAQINQLLNQKTLTLDQIRSFTAGDLANARAKATASGDIIGQALWQCLTPITQTPNPNEVGIATGLEDARIAESCLPTGGTPILP